MRLRGRHFGSLSIHAQIFSIVLASIACPRSIRLNVATLIPIMGATSRTVHFRAARYNVNISPKCVVRSFIQWLLRGRHGQIRGWWIALRGGCQKFRLADQFLPTWRARIDEGHGQIRGGEVAITLAAINLSAVAPPTITERMLCHMRFTE